MPYQNQLFAKKSKFSNFILKLKHCQLRDVKIHIFSKFHEDMLNNERENEKNLYSKSHETDNNILTIRSLKVLFNKVNSKQRITIQNETCKSNDFQH